MRDGQATDGSKWTPDDGVPIALPLSDPYAWGAVWVDGKWRFVVDPRIRILPEPKSKAR